MKKFSKNILDFLNKQQTNLQQDIIIYETLNNQWYTLNQAIKQTVDQKQKYNHIPATISKNLNTSPQTRKQYDIQEDNQRTYLKPIQQLYYKYYKNNR
ncbi:17485_t:CDS:2 [Gigaspora margarita]|uniref:17485_t:CDS:1 n=1 Tax=Gigaspora margarita TaxID=4874 RepID=A0ABM8VZS3_GIGMA|nr:17485_t:CDS:2 [Gigaspora margarita]